MIYKYKNKYNLVYYSAAHKAGYHQCNRNMIFECVVVNLYENVHTSDLALWDQGQGHGRQNISALTTKQTVRSCNLALIQDRKLIRHVCSSDNDIQSL